jgi:hypothetical protein
MTSVQRRVTFNADASGSVLNIAIKSLKKIISVAKTTKIYTIINIKELRMFIGNIKEPRMSTGVTSALNEHPKKALIITSPKLISCPCAIVRTVAALQQRATNKAIKKLKG